MKAVLRVVLEVTEFSSCQLTGDRERRALLECLEARRSTSSFLVVLSVVVVVVVKVSAFLSEEFRRLRLRLLAGGDDIDILLLSTKNE